MQTVQSKPRDHDLIKEVGTCSQCGGSPCIQGSDQPVERYAIPVKRLKLNARSYVFAKAPDGERWRCGPCTIAAWRIKQEAMRI